MSCVATSLRARSLNGPVFKSGDVDTCLGQLRRSGLTMLAPQSFSRPVTIDGIEQLARFRTIRTTPDLFEAGRVYYCQHRTPELVWHHHRCRMPMAAAAWANWSWWWR
jgi:hypothetical protein